MAGGSAGVRSMTGFGHGAVERDGLRVEVELKGVNHRFLDLKLRLPQESAGLEPGLRARLQEKVARGRIDVVVTLVSSRPREARLEVNRALVEGYLKAVGELKKEFGLRGSVGLETVLALPGVVAVRTEPTGNGLAGEAIVEAVDLAVAEYDAMRRQEGGRLVEDLNGRLRSVEEATRRIAREAEGLPSQYAERLRSRVAALAQGFEIDPARLAQEAAILAGRVDVTEETVRLLGYVEQARRTLASAAGPVGKTLDFVMQEMNREANTISSKAEAMGICREALAIKAEVEKMREQIQNLE